MALNISEDKLVAWTAPSSNDEASKCANAENIIKGAIKADSQLANHSFVVRSHGSYRNNTNVRKNSDVDIYVCCKDTFFYDMQFADYDSEGAGITPATYEFWQFKSELQQALYNRFGYNGMTPGNKAFDIHANTYRVDADVIACFEYRRYYQRNRYTGATSYESGIQSFSTTGEAIINWPEQNNTNGITKNNATGYKYKLLVRILKRLRYEMADLEIPEAKAISSYLVECMVYNVPNHAFTNRPYRDTLVQVLAHAYDNVNTVTVRDSEWTEMNEMNYLFRGGQPWTQQQAFDFISTAWEYLGLD